MSEDWKISIDYREMNKDFVYVKVYINNLGSGFRRKEEVSGGMKRNYGRKIRKRGGGGGAFKTKLGKRKQDGKGAIAG